MSTATLKQLVNALARELDGLQVVERALKAESEALRGTTPADIEAAVADKTSALVALGQLRSSREALTGRGSIRETIDGFITSTAAEKGEAERLLVALDTTGESCKNLNQSNGLLIGGLKERTEQSLGILRYGEATVTLYGEAGNRDSDLGSRSLGIA